MENKILTNLKKDPDSIIIFIILLSGGSTIYVKNYIIKFILGIVIPGLCFFIFQYGMKNKKNMKSIKTTLSESDIHNLVNNLELKILGIIGSASWLVNRLKNINIVTDYYSETGIFIFIFYILNILTLIISQDARIIESLIIRLNIETINVKKIDFYLLIINSFIWIIFTIVTVLYFYSHLIKNN